MRKHNFFVKFLIKINLSTNILLKKYLNKLNTINFSNITRSNKIIKIFVALIILFLSYVAIPNIYDEAEIKNELKDQLENRLGLNFNLSNNFEYSFFPRPNFTFQNTTILADQNTVSTIKKLKIYVSLNNLFSLKNIKIYDLILINSNFDLNRENYNFFIKLLDQNFEDIILRVQDSNIFYKNKNNEVLFINKIIKMKYYYDINESKNFISSENEIFNLPYSLELKKNKDKNKISSKLNLNFLKLKIENEIDYKDNTKKGFAILTERHNKNNITYEFDKDYLIFNFFDKANNQNFFLKGKFNFKPFFSIIQGNTKDINITSLFNPNSSLLQLIKTKIFYNKNINFDLNIHADKIDNYHNFTNFLLNSKITEGLIDFDNTKFSWKNDADFKISESLLYIKEGELILDGQIDLDIKNSDTVYKFLQTPKAYRSEIKDIVLKFNYNFDQKILNLNGIKIDNELNIIVNKSINSLVFKNSRLQNIIYLKNKLNSAIKAYAG